MERVERDILKCYDLLDVRPGASAEQVRKAYIELAHVWDPVKHVSNPPLRQQAQKKRAELDAAYNALLSFLPSLSPTAPPIPPHSAARPEDGVGDQIVAVQPPVKASAMLFGFVVLLMSSVIAIGLFSLLRGVHTLAGPAPMAPSVTSD